MTFAAFLQSEKHLFRSWTKQMSLPYQLGSGNPYMGQITGAPAARYVTKKGMFGKPKKWIDIYDVGAADDILSNYDYVGPENMNSYDGSNQEYGVNISSN